MASGQILTLGYGSFAGRQYIPTLEFIPEKAVAPQTEGGGFVYQIPKHRKEKPANREELSQINDQIAQAEAKQQQAQMRAAQAQADQMQKQAARRMAALEAKLQEEISELRQMRALLMRQIDDDEALAALLLSLPLN